MYRQPARDLDAELHSLAAGSGATASAYHAARVRRALAALAAAVLLLGGALAWGAHTSQRAGRAYRDPTVGTRTVSARAAMLRAAARYQAWVASERATAERLERGCKEALLAATSPGTEIRACEGPVCILCRPGREHTGPMKKVTAFIEP